MFSSLKTKLIVLCVTTIVAAMLTVATSNFYTTREHTSLQLEQQAGLLLKTQAKSIAEWVAAKQAAVASLQLASVDKDAQAAVKTAEKAGKFDMVFVAWPDKHAVFSQLRQRAADYDPTARAWFKGALQAGGPFISMPYIGASSGKLLITFADLIGDTKGPVAGADVLLGTVVDSVLDIRPTPQSYAFLLAADGTIIAHPDKELTLKPLGKLNAALDPNALRTLAQSGGALRSEFQGRPARLFIQTVGNTGWMLALVLDEAEATANLRSILSWSAASVVLVSILAGLLIFAFVTRLLRRVHELRDAIGAAGDGDFSQRLTASGQDELAQITEAFNRFSERITTVLHGIRGSSESVRSSSNEIASGNLDLSYRTEKQAASLAETASSVAKLTHNVKLNADSATQANILAGNASGVAERGGEVVAKVVDMMSTMNQSSKRIFDIISVIDQIAFQTNILALNAAVEAARAGEQGRGFAVVAAEVRSLAQRSATAAREIQTLITDSVERVESGTALVSEAGSTMQEIVQSVAQVTAIMSEITRASQVQAEDLEHINQAVTLMDGSTQQNAALVEEAAAAAGSLHDEASKLANSVSVFKLR